MTFFEAVFLGVLQGATEYLPVSSSGHLILAEHLLGLPDIPLVFDVMLHIGTLFAVLVYFQKDWLSMTSSLFYFKWGKRDDDKDDDKRDKNLYRRLPMCLMLGTIPGGLGGLVFSRYAETVFRSPWIVVFMLLTVAFLLALAERFSGMEREFSNIGLKDALIIGCSQALAIVPGVSRSGITMGTAMLLGLKREAAARFSFLLSAPIIAGSGLYEGFKLLRQQGLGAFSPDFVWGPLAAAVSGYLAVSFLMRYVARHTFYPFVYYRIIVSLFVAIILIK
ncbi:MAG: undecaprenyl-diphosphatase UppP [Dissulfurimicrobium sp.]|uniref:undecaprenyl-diphosphatase UppP n=1 Tax=Dissulfurimicrobium sp. TaxID=2022436 RepID=UPI003D151DD1